MSRSGYTDDYETIELYRRTVLNAVRGKRGQAFLRDLLAALDAMPSKRLIPHELVNESGEVCAIGSLGVQRGVDMSQIDALDRDSVAKAFGIAPSLAAEIEYLNDEWHAPETPEQRWARMRRWVERMLAGEEP